MEVCWTKWKVRSLLACVAALFAAPSFACDDDDEFYNQVLSPIFGPCRSVAPVTSPPSPPKVEASPNNRAFALIEEYRYEIGNTGVEIVIPAGFVTDFASIPRRLWSLYSPHDQYSRAALIHDWLYWTKLCKRKQADNLFLIAMMESDVKEPALTTIYRAVTLGGKSSWKENGDMRKMGLPKVIPMKLLNFEGNRPWKQIQGEYHLAGVRDPDFGSPNPIYCKYGDQPEVPYVPGRNFLRPMKNKAANDVALRKLAEWASQ